MHGISEQWLSQHKKTKTMPGSLWLYVTVQLTSQKEYENGYDDTSLGLVSELPMI